MMMIPQIVLLALLICHVTAMSSRTTAVGMTVMEEGHVMGLPQGWALTSAATIAGVDAGVNNNNDVIDVVFAVKRQNRDMMRVLIDDVSYPDSPHYGNYLSHEEVASRFAPAQADVLAVVEHLLSYGISQDVNGKGEHYALSSPQGEFISARVSVGTARDMFGTSFASYAHRSSSRRLVRSLGPYHLASHVASSVDYVSGVMGFPLHEDAEGRQTTPLVLSHHSAVKSSSHDNIIVSNKNNIMASPVKVAPADLRARYNVTGFGTQKNNSYAVAEFQGQYLSNTDLHTFWKQFVTFTNENDMNVTVVGQNDESNPGVEAALDIQYITGVAPLIDATFYSTPSIDFWSDITNWLASLAAKKEIPLVHSVSYGSQGLWPSSSYLNRTNEEFMLLGSRGVSVLFSSGDAGSGCELCFRFKPNYPASSPYVTAVGATQFADDQKAAGPEIAVTEFGSGGGFSPDDSTPSYQAKVVANYLKTASRLPLDGQYNKDGRATPDVSALGWGFQVVVRGAVSSVGGTSASTPTFAAIVALLNDIRISQGKPTLGFLNPWLYQVAAQYEDAFFDVTQGDNHDTCCLGFVCAKGWDPVTGLGTPNFKRLAQLV
eukprot:TRINITY_DN2749_c0_g1_i3.p1 TRINITY_DN2749_c0_g1~~TRINITY_DN2749_c0_g1_i3.p1  ORF type:complete len:602 (-),score=106.76 TRINITY_DN2749_c0_g1_i3:38-1843(-)